MVRPRSRAPLLVVLALVPALVAALAPPVVSAASPAAVGGREYRLDLLQGGDFVSQVTDVACVGASIQIMLNIIRDGADRSAATQARALKTAQRMSNPVFVRRSGGASARGWAYSLERMGGGPYRVRAYATRSAALRAVAVAIRTTGRPAGLLVWQGVHAWVVSGFRASADPAFAPRATVESLVVSDPWWPRPTNSRGPTIPPGSRLTPAALARHFVPFQRGPRRGGNLMNGSFVVVLPLDPAAVAEQAARMQ